MPTNYVLDSMTLILDDTCIFGQKSVDFFFNEDRSKYLLREVSKEKESLSPISWNMPEVFRKKLTAYSEFYFNEINEQNRLAGTVRYNFSNGDQISAKDILRSPMCKIVPKELLPQPHTQPSAFGRWPLTQHKEHLFLSQNLREVEDIMQVLLASIVNNLRQNRLKVYLQTKTNSQKGIEIKNIDFEPAEELDWRVEFSEKDTLEGEFKLISKNKKNFYFYESFCLEPEKRSLIVFSFLQEKRRLIEFLNDVLGENSFRADATDQLPLIHTEGELEAKAVLKYLRSRPIPVKITGDSVVLDASKSETVIQLNENGSFLIEHRARRIGFKDLQRKGWTSLSVLYLTALSNGLPFLLKTEAKNIANKARRYRDWDMKLLRHLGVMQYLMLEILSYYFEGSLTDGRIVEKENIFSTLHSKIHSLLLSGSGEVLARETPLVQLCSKAVLSHFEDFVSKTLNVLNQSESFYSEQGELILEGVAEREFRMIFELLKKLALTTGGEAFKKSRTTVLSKIWTGNMEKDPFLESGLFFIPSARKEGPTVHETLETLQGLIPFGFQIYYKGQPLQQLEDNDFKVDFILENDRAQVELNWFELNPRFFLRGQEIDPQNMASFGSAGVIEYEGRLYLVPRKQMPSLRRLENFWNKLQAGKKESSKKNASDKVYHLPKHQILELLALRASGYNVRGDAEWKKLCEFYDHLGQKNRELKLPKTLKADLKPYQALGVQWLQDLYNLKLGALLADDMGLGKTLQTLSFLEDLRVKKQLGQVLIVVPSSLIFNWKSEVEKFTPDLPLTVFSSRDSDRVAKLLESGQDIVVITTYGLLMEHENYLNQYLWKILIFDEAQNLKNITTKRASSARSLRAQFKICLTGTPMENHYGEFYSLMDLLVPGSLGKLEDFRRQFVNTDMIMREEIDDLKLKIRPLLMRRTKKEILDQLPEKQETKISIAFEDKQKQIYRDIALSYNQKVQESLTQQGEASVQLQMLTALLRLRQACSDPAALPNVRYDKVPPKLEALLDSLTEIVESGESALVFTQFIQTLEHTEKILKAANIPVFVLHGGIPTKQRENILAAFNKTPGGAVLVMTLKTGGVGLNLTKASYVFHLEPWWNPSVENQATDRAHRLGQSRAVQVFRYIMHESLEEKIEILKERKDKKFQSLFSNSEKEAELGSGSGALSKDDFDFLLGLK